MVIKMHATVYQMKTTEFPKQKNCKLQWKNVNFIIIFYVQ